MQVLPPVQLARPPRSWSSGAGGSRSRATAGPARNGPAPPSAATSAALPCAVSAGLPCGAVVGADVLGGPRVRWRFRVRAAPPRPRQARPSRTRRAMDPRRLGRDKRDPPVPGAQWTRAALGRDKRDPPVPGAQWTRAASVATSATLPCAVSAGLPCGAVVGADVLGGPRVRWHLRVQAVPKVNIGRICWNSVSRRCNSDDAVAGWSAAMRRVSSQPMAPRRAEGRCEAYQNQIRLCRLPPTGTNTAFGSSTYVPRTVRSRRSSCAYLR